MKNTALFNDDHRATYCPEDDKLRLYVGRVPREEYLALKKEGWTSTPKQECDFVAVWTADREDTAESYAGIIEDEDASPQDRAADRAERFAGYRENRIADATGHADRFDAGPAVHGYQSAARAEKAAARHDRQAGRAVSAWDKAEYWQRRTAGVIANALYKSRPDVRMGRIKTLEAELRKLEKEYTEARKSAQFRFDVARRVIDHAEGRAEKVLAGPWMEATLAEVKQATGTPEDALATDEDLRLASLANVFQGWRLNDAAEAVGTAARKAERPAAEIAREWLADRERPADWTPEESRHAQHLKLRLAYEWQMLEAQGGRAAAVEMIPGGFIGGHRVEAVNKSPKTGRVVSVMVRVPTRGRDKWGNEDPHAPEFRLERIKTERLAADAYRAPTPEELVAYQAEQDAEKAAARKAKKTAPAAPKLVNPTLADAERLQALINAEHAAAGRHYGEPEAREVLALSQAEYSAASKGAYARAEVAEFHGGGKQSAKTYHRRSRVMDARLGPVVCKVRVAGYAPARVVHLTDKPAKALPAALWEAHELPACQTPDGLRDRAGELREAMRLAGDWRDRDQLTPEQTELLHDAAVAGLVREPGCTTGEWQWREPGLDWIREHAPADTVTADA